MPQLVPTEGEVRVSKEYESAFERTRARRRAGPPRGSHIALAGAATNWRIRATAYGALERGYDLTLVA